MLLGTRYFQQFRLREMMFHENESLLIFLLKKYCYIHCLPSLKNILIILSRQLFEESYTCLGPVKSGLIVTRVIPDEQIGRQKL